MGKAFNLRRDMARSRPCRACGQQVMIVQIDYRVVPPFEGDPDPALDLLALPTLAATVLDRDPDPEGFYVVNTDPTVAGEGFVAYDPEMSLDDTTWGYVRFRGHNCPTVADKWERAHGNRTFIDGRIERPERADRVAAASGA